MQRAFAQQKKLIVIALAAAAFSAPALADTANVSVYGIADMSYDFINTGTSAAGVGGVSKNAVSSNVSRLGFKGSEGLGDGLSAIWQIEQQINMDNTGGTFATRNSFLGLKSDSAGTVLLGRHDTPYKLATRKLDPFGDSIADNRALLGAVSGKSAAAAFDGRQPDVIAYISPSMSGLTGAIAYVNLTETNTTAAQAKASALSLNAVYDAKPLLASFGYEKHDLDTVQAGASESAWKLGLGYTMSAFTLGFVYERTSDNLTPATYAERYGHNKAGQLGSTANTGANHFTLGYDHGMSKRTKLYALYSRISNQSGINYGFTQSTAAAGTINGIGASPSVISLGMKHTF